MISGARLDKLIDLDSIGVAYACVLPSQLSEHSDSNLNVVIPFKPAFIQTTWQTATRQKKWRCVSQGHISIIPANLPHEAHWEQQSEVVVLKFDPAFIVQAADELNGRQTEIVEQWNARDSLIQQLALALRKEFQEGLPGRLYIESVANVLVTHLLRSYSSSGQPVQEFTGGLPNYKLRHATEYINDNFERDLNLAEIAAAVEMSVYHFARLFKQSTGLAPHQYIMECRIERAKELLTNKNLSLAEIAYRVGFASQSHFTTIFRKLTATTPKAYREAC